MEEACTYSCCSDGSRMRTVTGPPFIADNDLLSVLPGDCIRRVLSYLDREHLETMQNVSRRMYNFASSCEFESAK
ncbi:hypothetical protein PFISCL1PPCAC_29054, partial [Pristionchus fissidentatus]